MNYPILVTTLIFLLCLARFIWIMTHERRSLRAGFSFVITLFSFLLLGVVILVNIADLDPHYKRLDSAVICNRLGCSHCRYGNFCRNFNHYVFL